MMLSVPAPKGWQGLSFGATSSPYSSSHPHRGQDWGWYYGNPVESKRVYSNCTGVVTRVWDGYGTGKNENEGWGCGVEIQVARNAVSKLWHFNKGTIQVREGQSVTPSTFIAPMGNSGWTNGETHLHEELWIDGVRVDPQFYRTHDIPGTGSTAGGGAKPFEPPTPSKPTTPLEEDLPMQFLLITEHSLGGGDTSGIDRWLVTVSSIDGNATKRLISSVKEELYRAAGVPTPYPGLQQKTLADEFPTVT